MKAEAGDETKTRRLHNRDTIERYVVFYDSVFPMSMGFINVEEMENKPESRPPTPDSERVWDYIEDQENQDTAKYLNRPFQVLRKEHPPLYTVLGLVGGWIKPMQNEETDHAALRRWRAGETEQDKYRAKLFERALSKMEEKLNDYHPTLRINVNIERKDEPVSGHREDYDRGRAWDKEDSYRQIDAEITAILTAEQCSVEAAIGVYRDRLERDKKPDVSPRKIREARAFVRDENSNDAA